MSDPGIAMPLLIPAGLFACPRCGSSAVIPTAQLLWTGEQPLGVLGGVCNRCEHSYQFSVGSPSTTTSGTTNVQGATTLTVASGTSFTSGSWIVIDSTSTDGGVEVVQASAAGGSTTIPIASTPLRLTHNSGASVNAAVLAPLGPMT